MHKNIIKLQYFVTYVSYFYILVPQKHISPHITPFPLHAQPVTFPLFDVCSLRKHFELQEQLIGGASVDYNWQKVIFIR